MKVKLPFVDEYNQIFFSYYDEIVKIIIIIVIVMVIFKYTNRIIYKIKPKIKHKNNLWLSKEEYCKLKEDCLIKFRDMVKKGS